MDNGWHSVAVVFDGDEDTIYVDGEQVNAEGKTVCKWFRVTGPGMITVEVDE